jgi:hypothetical protein
MPRPVGSTIDMLLDVSLDTVIGAMFLAFLIAAMTAGAYLWIRRGKSDATGILVALILVANLACLVTGAGFSQSRSQSRRIGSGYSSQANGKINASSRSVRSGNRSRRTSFSQAIPAKRSVNSEDAPSVSLKRLTRSTPTKP